MTALMPNEPAIYRPITMGHFEFTPSGNGGWAWRCLVCLPERRARAGRWRPMMHGCLDHACCLEHLRTLARLHAREDLRSPAPYATVGEEITTAGEGTRD